MGRYTRFVSHSVMTGFLTGVSLILILSQFGDFVGYPATGANSVAKAWDTLTHIPEWSMPALAIGASAIVIAIALDRTPLSTIGPLLAIVVPSVVVAMRPQAEVALASDTAEIPAGLPMPALPSLDYLTSTTVTSALAITVVILVQSSGVAGQFRNPDGAPSNISRDFVAHGAANLATSLFRGIPVGGSVGQTAFNVLAGGVGRLSVITSGAWMILFLVALSGIVGQVAMPTLAALLILAGFQSLKPREVRAVWRTTRSGAVLMTLTLVATLFLPVTVAVGLGVILSAIHTLNRSMNEVRVLTLVEVEGRGTALRPAPEELPAGEVTVLDIEGNLFYAGARSLEGTLPRVVPGSRPVVVLRLRGRDRIGATLVKVLEWYSGQIRDAGGRLYLSGVDPRVAEQIQRNGLIGAEDLTVVEATEILGESTRTAAHRRHHVAARGDVPGRVVRWARARGVAMRRVLARQPAPGVSVVGTRSAGRMKTASSSRGTTVRSALDPGGGDPVQDRVGDLGQDQLGPGSAQLPAELGQGLGAGVVDVGHGGGVDDQHLDGRGRWRPAHARTRSPKKRGVLEEQWGAEPIHEHVVELTGGRELDPRLQPGDHVSVGEQDRVVGVVLAAQPVDQRQDDRQEDALLHAHERHHQQGDDGDEELVAGSCARRRAGCRP